MAKQQYNPIKAYTELWSDVCADYVIAQQSRLKRTRAGVSGIGRGADYHYRTEQALMLAMEIARDEDRNNQIIGQGITRLCRNVLQGGISLDSKSGNRDLDNELEDRWHTEFNDESFSSTGELTGHQQAELTLRHTIVDGDVIGLPRVDNTLQMVEAHRLRSPYNTSRNVIHGILFDDDARPQQYWITKEDLSPFSSVQNVRDVDKIPARNEDGEKQVLHVFNPKRLSQRRGFTALAPVAFPSGMLDDTLIAKLVQQQTASAIAILTEREADTKYTKTSTRTPKGSQREETREDGSTQTIEGLACGLQIRGNPGETLKGFSPNIPNPEFFPHARLVLTIIALNLDLPLIVFLMDASETNFSGWRGAMDQAKIGFRALQKLLVTKFYRPLYRWRLRNWLASDASLRNRVRAASRDDSKFNVYRHLWNPPTWPYIEPVKDATAGMLRRHGLLTSPRRLAAEDGLDWREEIVTESISDNSFAISSAIAEAIALNKLIPPDLLEKWGLVHWRDVLSLPMADKITMTVSAQQQVPEKPEPAAPAGPPKPGNGSLEVNRVADMILAAPDNSSS